MKQLISAAALLFPVMALVGCTSSFQQRAYEYMPDMVRDPAYKAFAPNTVTRDGLTLQRPVAGAIPRGYTPFHYGRGEAEAERAGRDLQIPSVLRVKRSKKAKRCF